MMTLNDGRSELWQWDTGRTLSVPDDCSQVHFSNKVFGRSVDVDVVDGKASIPDILLQTDKELTAWAFVGTAENGYTKISKVFNVNKRNKPADYVFTPTDQTTLSELVERLDEIEESQDPNAIKNAVDEYLANNPIRVDEKDPTVPEWAKQPTKPKYTADEVGAQPKGDYVLRDELPDIPEGGGVSDYTELENKPSINGVELDGNKTSADLGIGNPTDEQVKTSVYSYLAENPVKNTKTVTENDLRIYHGWVFGRNALSTTYGTASTHSTSAPFWMEKDTVLTKTIGKRVDIYGYTGDTTTYANGFSYYNNWSTTNIGATYTIPESGWYVFDVWLYGGNNKHTPFYDPAFVGAEGYAAIQKPPFTFSYTAYADFEPAYQFTIDWKCPGIQTPGIVSIELYSNGLFQACHREIGYPCYLNSQNRGSITAMYRVFSDLTTTTLSVGYSSDLLAYKDELWIITTGSDTHEYLTNITKLKVYENGWVERLGEIETNIGHVNAIRYDAETDTLTWGNGSGDYALEGEIYIINNFSKCPLATKYDSSIILWDDLLNDGWIESLALSIADYGFKLNFIGYCEPTWNANSADVRRLSVALLSNDGNTLRLGYIVPTRNDDGTKKYSLTKLSWYRTVNIGNTEETQKESYVHCVQGMDAYNGKIVWGNGHDKKWIASVKCAPSSLTVKPTAANMAVTRGDLILQENISNIRGIAIQGNRLYIIGDYNISWYDANIIYSI